MDYYSRVNPDLLRLVPINARVLLEIGCGTGSLAGVLRHRNPRLQSVGVELNAVAAEAAAKVMDHVVTGSIEQAEVLDRLTATLSSNGLEPDTLVLGDVLEHLIDPWATLQALRQRMSPQAVCSACIPNVSHWSLVQQLLLGRWDYQDQGLLDRTHLRFFTLDTAIRMFEQSGWRVQDATPRIINPQRAEAAFNQLTPALEAIGVSVEKARRDLTAFQWVIRAVNGPVHPALSVAALGLRKFAGVTEARVDYPMMALASQPGVSATWSSESLKLPSGRSEGILVLHRQFMNQPDFNAFIERQIEKGWTVVADMDDDPRHWSGYVDSNFHAFRGVHAVTVSTPSLAELIQQWNPHVHVFPNQILQLPDVSDACPKSDRPRIFFGALNRRNDWHPIREGILAAARQLGRNVQWVIVHDREFFDLLPEEVDREFHDTMSPEHYMGCLSTCDINLLPLLDTQFNRLKSDLKFIESCAAGVVPICSEVVYGDNPIHRQIGMFAVDALQWQQSILALSLDASNLQRRRDQARAYIVSDRLHANHVEERLKVYRDWVTRHAELERDRRKRLGRMA